MLRAARVPGGDVAGADSAHLAGAGAGGPPHAVVEQRGDAAARYQVVAVDDTGSVEDVLADVVLKAQGDMEQGGLQAHSA